MPPPEPVAALVRWFWIPEWRIAPGRTSRQQIIAFPACNLVVGPAGVELAGPTTRLSHRDLTGVGWAVGALLRPAAVPHFTPDPALLRDTSRVVELPELHRAVVEAMDGTDDPTVRHARAVAAFTDWLAATIGPPGPEALHANDLAELVDTDPQVLRVEDIAARLHVSVRTVQRLGRRYVGLPPLTMIRRRRLQEAAHLLRTDPDTELATLAARLGYADQAHLANEFRTVLGFTPSAYRRESTPP
ncbi:helix-turn-helix transcriptional regulator [Solwaraspora sp. WMMD406]|uniref:helix-turn-helix transcriptional regulator n=1 Tax=Solwaraspora sp. WMMD406 TaxID=3016095 RepID=UPI002415D293|nr:helix-turn-helix transcriptional regulator [Solwaraspora sp. WMMD406]MDG4768088.1 helix-turn-helix transcriptional regulator [Solwaraspora sp. WMMD406]